MHCELPLSAVLVVAAVLAAVPRALAQVPGAPPAPAPAAQPAAQPAAAQKTPSALVPAARTDKGAIEREQELLRRAREATPAKVVFVGDSITQGWEGAGSAVWRERFQPLGLNLGNSGDRTEHVLWRLQQAPLTRLQPEHVVLLIGTNNLGHGTSNAAETLAGIEAVVQLLREQVPDAKVHVLEIFPRGETVNPMRGDICQINQALRAFARATNAAARGSSPHVFVHAIGDAFVDGDGRIDKAIMPDFLHLSPQGYAMWGEALAPLLQ